SASGCRTPLGPTRYGPSRCCSSAATLRSTYTITAAEFSSMKKTKSVRTIWATSSGVMRSTVHHEDSKSHEEHDDSLGQEERRGLRGSSRLRDTSSFSVRSHRLSRPPVGRQRAPSFPDMRFVLVPEVLQRGQDRRDGGVAERAQRLAGDIPGYAAEEVKIAHLAFTSLDPPENLEEPVGAFAARRAFATRLVAVEMQQVLRQPHHAGRVVEHDDRRGAEERSSLLNRVEAGRRVELIRHQNRNGGSARDDRLQRAPVTHPPGVAVDELAERDVHRRLEDARLLHVAADAVQLRSAVFLGTDRGEPLRAARDDDRNVAQRLDVVDGARFAVQACDCRKRRLVARLGPLALQRFEQRGFLP